MLVKDIMTVNVVTINQNQTLLELQGLMSDDNIRRVPVVNDAGMVVGIITDKDVRMADGFPFGSKYPLPLRSFLPVKPY